MYKPFVSDLLFVVFFSKTICLLTRELLARPFLTCDISFSCSSYHASNELGDLMKLNKRFSIL